MKPMNPAKILAERRKDRWGIDDQLFIDSLEATFEFPILPLDFSEGKSQKGEGWINEENAIRSAEPHYEMLFSLDHTVPSICSKIDDLSRQLIHKIGSMDKNF